MGIVGRGFRSGLPLFSLLPFSENSGGEPGGRGHFEGDCGEVCDAMMKVE